MAKLTRKLWISIGAVGIASAPLPPLVAAQDARHKAHQPANSPVPQAASSSATEGGEAYLTDGGPKDTRVRFYRDIALMRGHLLVGNELIAKDLWDEALPHFLHPTEELYALLEKYIKLHHITPFDRDLKALAQTVKAKRKGAYEERLRIVDQRLSTALETAKRFMTPPVRTFTVRSAMAVLRVAQSEYETAIEEGKFTKPVEYQDSRGFVWQSERMLDAIGTELKGIDAAAFAKVRADFERLKAAWPDLLPPPAPLLAPGEISALIAAIELNAARF
jgi:hypothetical protein